MAEAAAALARDMAPGLSAVLITHFLDAETLDVFRPSEDDLAVVGAVNRAVAAALAVEGVEVFVQVADKASFRRWMDQHPDAPGKQSAWRNRGGMLRGADALRALGLDPSAARPRNKPGRASGTPAERLMRAFADEEGSEFPDLADELLREGREGVLALAIRKTADRYGEEAADDMERELLELAEAADLGPSGWSQLVTVPVALPPGPPPDAESLGASLAASGVLEEQAEVRFLPGWRSPETFARLTPCALRRALVEMLEGREPAAMPPAAPEALSEGGFGVLVGLQIDWGIPTWEEIAANGPPEEPEDEKAPEDRALAERFDRWRMAVAEAVEGCVPLGILAPSQVEAEIEDFLAEAGQHTDGVDEIREFVEVARREAPGEEVVCRPEVAGDSLELTLFTRSGRLLDSLTLPPERLPLRPEEMPRLLKVFVPLVEDVPGR